MGAISLAEATPKGAVFTQVKGTVRNITMQQGRW